MHRINCCDWSLLWSFYLTVIPPPPPLTLRPRCSTHHVYCLHFIARPKLLKLVFFSFSKCLNWSWAQTAPCSKVPKSYKWAEGDRSIYVICVFNKGTSSGEIREPLENVPKQQQLIIRRARGSWFTTYLVYLLLIISPRTAVPVVLPYAYHLAFYANVSFRSYHLSRNALDKTGGGKEKEERCAGCDPIDFRILAHAESMVTNQLVPLVSKLLL